MHYFLDLFRVGPHIVCMKYKTDISLGHWLYMELSGLVLDCGADWHSAWRAECPWNSRCFRILNFSLRNKNFTQVVLISLVFLIDVSFGELATCNPQNRECSCADTSSRVSVSFSYKSLKGGLSQFGDRLWSVISFLFLYIYPFNSIRSPNLGPAYLSISKDGGGGPLCLSEISWGWVPILFGKWLLVEWFTIFKTILEHWMPKNLQNNVWLLKFLLVERRLTQFENLVFLTLIGLNSGLWGLLPIREVPCGQHWKMHGVVSGGQLPKRAN